MKKSKKRVRPFAELVQVVAAKLRPPFGILLGSPGEVAELVQALPEGETTCYQTDLFQAARLQEILANRGSARPSSKRARTCGICRRPSRRLSIPSPTAANVR